MCVLEEGERRRERKKKQPSWVSTFIKVRVKKEVHNRSSTYLPKLNYVTFS